MDFATSLSLPAGELKLASNSRYKSAELRARAADETAEERNRSAEERERAARCHQLQARSLRAGALFQLEPSALHRRFLSLIAIELEG